MSGSTVAHSRTASMSASRAMATTVKPKRCEFVLERLPDRQLEATASPRRPGEQQDLAALEVGERDQLAVEIGQGEAGASSDAIDSATVWAATPSAAMPRRASTTTGRPRAAAAPATSRRPPASKPARSRTGHADVVPAQSFGLQGPPRGHGELGRRDRESIPVRGRDLALAFVVDERCHRTPFITGLPTTRVGQPVEF